MGIRRKSPAKQVIYWELHHAEEEVRRWLIIRDERIADATDKLRQVEEAKDQIRRFQEAIADHLDAIKAIDRMERVERKGRAA